MSESRIFEWRQLYIFRTNFVRGFIAIDMFLVSYFSAQILENIYSIDSKLEKKLCTHCDKLI